MTTGTTMRMRTTASAPVLAAVSNYLQGRKQVLINDLKDRGQASGDTQGQQQQHSAIQWFCRPTPSLTSFARGYFSFFLFTLLILIFTAPFVNR
jgi:hypothetical protein